MRMGFKGETQVNDMITGYGQWEYQVQASSTEGIKATRTRLAFAGTKSATTVHSTGRNYGVMYDVEGWTDMLPEFGGDSYTKADNFTTGRANGVATYRNTDCFGLVDGLNVATAVPGANENQSPEQEAPITVATIVNMKNSNGDGFGISSTYDLVWA